MPLSLKSPLFAAALAAGLAAPALAQDLPTPVVARQGLMQNMQLNLGVLAQMARGTVDYDADAAAAAAANLMTIGQIDMRFLWPEGTDNFALDGTRALPAIWEDPEGVAEDWNDFATAAAALAETAGTGLDAVRAGLGPVGGACGACHDDYREAR